MRRFFLFISFLSFIISPALAQNDLRNYKMAGPYEVVARDGKYRASKGGSERDMWTAYECAQLAHAQFFKCTQNLSVLFKNARKGNAFIPHHQSD